MNNNTWIDDINRCILSIRNGDLNKIEELHNLLAGMPYYIALRYLKNEEDARDVVQEFWCNILSTIAKIHFLTNGYRYLCRTIENIAKMKLRLRQKEMSIFEDFPNDLSIFENLENKELLIALQMSLKALDEKEYEVISLIYFEHKTIRETSRILGKSKSTVDRIKGAAINHLKILMKEKGWDKESF